MFLPEDFVSTHSHLLLVYQQPLISPLDDKEGIEGDAEVLVVNLGDVLDVDPHVHHCARLVGKVKFGIVFWNADGVPLKDGTCYCYLSIKACTHCPTFTEVQQTKAAKTISQKKSFGKQLELPSTMRQLVWQTDLRVKLEWLLWNIHCFSLLLFSLSNLNLIL